jgi:hypothetical protein
LLGTGTGTITCPLSSCTRVASAVFVLEGPALYRGLLRNSCPSRWASGCEGLEIIHCACTLCCLGHVLLAELHQFFVYPLHRCRWLPRWAD